MDIGATFLEEYLRRWLRIISPRENISETKNIGPVQTSQILEISKNIMERVLDNTHSLIDAKPGITFYASKLMNEKMYTLHAILIATMTVLYPPPDDKLHSVSREYAYSKKYCDKIEHVFGDIVLACENWDRKTDLPTTVQLETFVNWYETFDFRSKNISRLFE